MPFTVALALLRDAPGEALALMRQALGVDPSLACVGDRAAAVRAALPELERLVRERSLAEVMRHHPEQPLAPPGLLDDLAELLRSCPEGEALFAAADRGDLPAARQALAVLAGRDDLPARLAHHLALVYQRAALFLEEREQSREADVFWRLAWHCWLRWAAQTDAPAPPAPHPRAVLFHHLLAYHRRRVSELLARGGVDQARRHWGYVMRLPEMVPRAAPVTAELHQQALHFRENLATEYLLATREAMRHGEIAEGWRADYEKGLALLRRLLSLDRDNVRLLTALIEICANWFLDCYNNEDAARLWRQVERFTPFALQLARLVEARPAELAARAALAEFFKFRGFISPERNFKAAHYREALRFNPANENVRDLLTELGEPP